MNDLPKGMNANTSYLLVRTLIKLTRSLLTAYKYCSALKEVGDLYFLHV